MTSNQFGVPTAAELYGAPAVADVRLAPDGTRLAYLAPAHRALGVWTCRPDGSERQLVLDDGGRPPTSLAWSADGNSLLFLRDGGGDELWHLYAVDMRGGVARDLTPYDGVQAQLVGVSPDQPDVVAVALNLEDATRHDLYRLDVRTMELDGPVSRGASRWCVDWSLKPRLGVRLRPDGGADVIVPDEAQRVIDVVPPDGVVSLLLGQIGVSHDGATAYVLAPADGTIGLVAYELASGARQVLHSDPDFDVAGWSSAPETGSPDLVCVDGERRRWRPLGATAADGLNMASTDAVGVERGGTTWLVKRVRDAGAAVYTDRDGVVVLSERPELDSYELGQTEPFFFHARDGLLVHGYVTWPPGRERRGLPAVLWVHGGPWSRDSWGFSPVVQLLATRGYAVVQVNFRGSTGYGKAFLDAGDREWGRLMQSDLSDAIDALSGRIDEHRVAIAGGSYGGYATLMGLVSDPDRFACGVAWCAPSSLLTLLRSFPAYWAPTLAHWYARVGHPDHDADELWQRSPLAHLDQLRAPLLLIHGANDPRVLVGESEAVAAALGDRCELHVVADEGHGFVKPESNIWLLEQVERFLAQHLPAD
jgi:dipeptidyl aminopeptidase/acylaminoacyl peptidase